MPTPSEVLPFVVLEDRLLRGGIAPRHVRRYLRELSEHLADLTEAQRAAGHDGETAAARAHAALGPDEELAGAMLKQRDFRSISARFPWLVFGVTIPFATILVMLVPCLLLLTLMATDNITLQNTGLPTPNWFKLTAVTVVAFNNLVLAPLMAAFFAVIAYRQRLSMIWPALSIAVMLLFWFHMNITFIEASQGASSLTANYRTNPRGGSLGVGIAPLFLPQSWPRITAAWPLFVAQSLLTLLPLVWLLKARRSRLAATPTRK